MKDATKRDDWFRLTTWTPADALNFRARLKRSRTAFHKAQYLRIQASILLDFGLPSAALMLLDEIAKEYPDETWNHVHFHRAEALWALGEKQRSFAAYVEAINVQRTIPHVRVEVALRFAEHFHDFENGAHRAMLLGLLLKEAQVALASHPFPSEEYRYGVVFARLYEGLGDRDSAARSAKLALDAVKREDSGYLKHPKLGLVRDTDDKVNRWLRKLVMSNERLATGPERPAPWVKSNIHPELQSPPRTEAQARHEATVRANIKASEPIDNELRQAGLPFRVDDLVSVRANYAEAIPILARHLNDQLPEDVLCGLFRAIAVPYAGASVFYQLLELAKIKAYSWGDDTLFALGIALANTMNKKLLPEAIQLVSNRELGQVRYEPALRIARWKHPDIVPALLDLLSDERAGWFAIRGLINQRAFGFTDRVKPLVDSALESVRDQAKRYLKLAEKLEV